MTDSTSPTTQLSEMHLQRRDAGAIAYSKSMLLEGDTLVFIKYPGGITAYDVTGFPLATKLRVNSAKLLATGSNVFKRLLGPLMQARYRRSHKLQRDEDLPAGIRFVLDLTPPDEGDDAVDQISNLSCPKGILHWSTSEARCDTPTKLVAGKDEVAGPNYEPPIPPHFSESSPETKAADNVVRGFDVNPEELRQAIENSRRDSGRYEDTLSAGTPNYIATSAVSNSFETPKEYCPIRHRAGIERLLQIIEGKEPRLDSAPKIWTVSMLSKFFDCMSVVVDAVCTWVLTGKNAMILEILPEACLRLGLTLQSQLLTRASYAVLVSEEAMCVAGQDESIPYARTPSTPFGRLRDEIDEDTLNMVQHAGRDFQARIDNQVRNLVEESMIWLTTLPEHHKLQNLALFIEHPDRSDSSDKKMAMEAITDLEDGLRHYIRGRLFHCLLRQLYPDQISAANSHRAFEQYIKPSRTDFRDLYDSLSSQQRVLTRSFWEVVRSLSWTIVCKSNLIYDKLDVVNPHSVNDTNLVVAKYFNIKKTSINDLLYLKDSFDQVVLRAVTTGGYMGATLPKEALPLADGGDDSDENLNTFSEEIEALRSSVGSVGLGHQGSPSTKHLLGSKSRPQPRIPALHNVPAHSPFFDLPVFLQQVSKRVHGVCETMLSKGENSGFSLPDTLLCLNDDEYKYLPLFAGGFEDGTGGVYVDELPPAIAGPSGPGPAYHTGFSVDSAASSQIDFDCESTIFGIESTVGWSQAVDNGESDHIDRRRVQSEVSFGTLDFEDLGMDIGNGKGKAVDHRVAGSESSFGTLDFEDIQEYSGNGKGKEADRDRGTASSSGVTNDTSELVAPTGGDSIMNDNFWVEDDVNDFEFENDSGDETEKDDGVMV